MLHYHQCNAAFPVCRGAYQLAGGECDCVSSKLDETRCPKISYQGFRLGAQIRQCATEISETIIRVGYTSITVYN